MTVGLIGATGALLWSGRALLASRGAAGPVRQLEVPRTAAAIAIDGEASEPAWRGAARTGALIGAPGASTQPFAEARALWGDGKLYLSLYAADRDIRSQPVAAEGPVWLADHFHLVFGKGDDERVFDISPRGMITDGRRKPGGGYDYAWQSGARVAADTDGTIDDPGDEDEEWALELAIPLDALGLRGEPGEQIEVSIRHCDVPRAGQRSCSSFGERGTRAVLALR